MSIDLEESIQSSVYEIVSKILENYGFVDENLSNGDFKEIENEEEQKCNHDFIKQDIIEDFFAN